MMGIGVHQYEIENDQGVAIFNHHYRFPVLAEIEEVIVTAAKREQSLQDVPIAVSVVDGEIIERSGMIDLFDLSLSVPSMKMNQLQQSVQSSV